MNREIKGGGVVEGLPEQILDTYSNTPLKGKLMRGGVNTRKWRGDHGSSQDYTTFFFSNFPHGYTETDLLKVFQRWAPE